MGDRSGGESVVSDDAVLLVVVDGERARRTDRGGVEGLPLEPEIERPDPAVERLDIVVDAEGFRAAEPRHLLGSGAAHQLDHGRLDLSRAIERVVECLPGCRVEGELGAVGKDHLRATPSTLDKELRDGFADRNNPTVGLPACRF